MSNLIHKGDALIRKAIADHPNWTAYKIAQALWATDEARRIWATSEGCRSKVRHTLSDSRRIPVDAGNENAQDELRREAKEAGDAQDSKRWRAHAAQLQAELDSMRSVFLPKSRKIEKAGRDNDSETTAVVALSDWHVEESVRPEQVNGLNEYNPEVVKRRSAQVFQKVVKLVEIWRAGTQVDVLVLGLLGDFITGYIHEELCKTNSMTPQEAASFAAGELSSGIHFLLEHGGFAQMIVVCTVGNHGRTTVKKSFSTATRENYETGIYQLLAGEFKEYGVEFMLPTAYMQVVDVYGRKIRFHHGDAIRYKDGVGGLTIPANKRIANWDRAGKAYLDIFGHHHTQLPSDRFISNGSLIGYNAFAAGNGMPYAPPSQTLVFIEAKHGLTGYAPIWV